MITDLNELRNKKIDCGMNELSELILSMRNVNGSMNPIFDELKSQPGENQRVIKTEDLKNLKSSANKLNIIIDNILKNNKI